MKMGGKEELEFMVEKLGHVRVRDVRRGSVERVQAADDEVESRRQRRTLHEVQVGRTRFQGEGSGRKRRSLCGNATSGILRTVAAEEKGLKELKLMFIDVREVELLEEFWEYGKYARLRSEESRRWMGGGVRKEVGGSRISKRKKRSRVFFNTKTAVRLVGERRRLHPQWDEEEVREDQREDEGVVRHGRRRGWSTRRMHR